MNKPKITPAPGGEYSTTQVGDYIETCWFGNDGSSHVIARTYFSEIAAAHVAGQTYRPGDNG